MRLAFTGTAGVSPAEARSAHGKRPDAAHLPLMIVVILFLAPRGVCALRASAGETPAVPVKSCAGRRRAEMPLFKNGSHAAPFQEARR
jgi:hypothetical protein